ncbi:sigma 54-interacting transcriptional regulator [Ichthyenterobacterium sp. W332]|uniref:Sigma 54-interacting transcriptional regulator n=1 Tax=Microcosmobacter mediterraneus TaxID=3075607 RepID=A0ABU2YGV6_9FLAO|nr:sigma 54-interacting transcriptional regulator [Ichthyenterobacterium sp. W332]MDT0557404.1 sigma 54-interacting transcriptional regulator [Ichthyenterobacterium sp. W332]
MAQIASEKIIRLLSHSTFFSEVSESSLFHLSQFVTEESFKNNEVVFNKDDEGDAMYVIVQGQVKVHVKDHIYTHLNEGDCFGEYALIDNDVRSASITATKPLTLLKIEHHHFMDLLHKDKNLVKGVLSLLIKRHRELDDIQELLTNSNRALELASSKTKGLIEGAMDAIIMFDSKFRIVLTNPSANELLENNDTIQRNILFFFDEPSAKIIESIISSEDKTLLDNHLPEILKVIGSNETETLNEGTISQYGTENETFYTLILRNINERLKAEEKINLLTKQTEYLTEEIRFLTNDHGITAEDNSMKSVLKQIDQVAKTNATVLVTGETGTGKELIARAIHKNSTRNDKALIRINCGAIPHNLIESELFGHKKGAFTGATSDRKGRFLLADKGTIFLDEIGEMPLDLQPKLLRVIQEGEFDPVGSSKTIKVDVRIIAATHRNLLQHAQNGKFREDLYYRLNVFPIEVPALRNRGNDVCHIATEMIQQLSSKLNKPYLELSESAKRLLTSYHWPGNVRELQNLVERALIVSQDGRINWQSIIPAESNIIENNIDQAQEKILTTKQLVQLEKDNILKALRLTHWKISGKNGAAELLKMKPTTLASRIKALAIERPI